MAYRQNPIESEEEGEEEVEEEDKDEGKGHQIILCMQKCIKKRRNWEAVDKGIL